MPPIKEMYHGIIAEVQMMGGADSPPMLKIKRKILAEHRELLSSWFA